MRLSSNVEDYVDEYIERVKDEYLSSYLHDSQGKIYSDIIIGKFRALARELEEELFLVNAGTIKAVSEETVSDNGDMVVTISVSEGSTNIDLVTVTLKASLSPKFGNLMFKKYPMIVTTHTDKYRGRKIVYG